MRECELTFLRERWLCSADRGCSGNDPAYHCLGRTLGGSRAAPSSASGPSVLNHGYNALKSFYITTGKLAGVRSTREAVDSPYKNSIETYLCGCLARMSAAPCVTMRTNDADKMPLSYIRGSPLMTRNIWDNDTSEYGLPRYYGKNN